MLDKKVITRWAQESELTHGLKKIFAQFQKGGTYRNDFFSTPMINGRADLMGVNFSKETIRNFRFTDVDFSFSSFSRCWVENNFFKNCKFDKVDFSEISDHNNNFINCSFTNCKFNSAAIGFGGSIFSECIFEKCKFSKTIFNRPEFIQVVFKNCNIKKVDFNASSFEKCSFEGDLIDVWFRGGFALKSDEHHYGKAKVNNMEEVSFEKAELTDPCFSDNCNLATVKIKQSGDYYKYDRWKDRLLFLKEVSQTWSEKEKNEVQIFADTYLVHAANQQWQIINKKDLISYYGSDLSKKILDSLNL